MHNAVHHVSKWVRALSQDNVEVVRHEGECQDYDASHGSCSEDLLARAISEGLREPRLPPLCARSDVKHTPWRMMTN